MFFEQVYGIHLLVLELSLYRNTVSRKLCYKHKCTLRILYCLLTKKSKHFLWGFFDKAES